MEETKKCPKCNSEMTKGIFAPSVGVVGMEWTDKLEYSKWKFEKVNKIKTFQYIISGTIFFAGNASLFFKHGKDAAHS